MNRKIKFKRYNILEDYSEVYGFLQDTYNLETLNSYLLPQYFEYANYSPWFQRDEAHRMGIWKEESKIVAFAAYEMFPGTVHLHTRTGYEFLYPEMLAWAEKELAVVVEGRNVLKVCVTSNEENKIRLLEENGYELSATKSSDIQVFSFENEFVQTALPEGYRMINGNDADFEKVALCFWEGFGAFQGEMKPEYVEGYRRIFSSPNGDKSLMTIIVEPEGEYACALGMWVDYTNHYAYLEPMATRPKYQGLGLGKAALLAAMEKTKQLGATYCFGGSVPFYKAIGFKKIASLDTWEKVL